MPELVRMTCAYYNDPDEAGCLSRALAQFDEAFKTQKCALQAFNTISDRAWFLNEEYHARRTRHFS